VVDVRSFISGAILALLVILIAIPLVAVWAAANALDRAHAKTDALLSTQFTLAYFGEDDDYV
jgi:hypothetical protein